MVNPGEMHDGTPVGGCARGWRMLYLDPALVARQAAAEEAGRPEITSPAVRDPMLAEHFARLFAHATAPAPDRLADARTTGAEASPVHGVRSHFSDPVRRAAVR